MNFWMTYVYDLLDDRHLCSVRQGEDGKTYVRADTVTHEDGGVTVNPLKTLHTDTQEGLDAIVSLGMSVRKVGSSETHDESSRSHALLYLEIVSKELVALRETIMRQEGEVVRTGRVHAAKAIAEVEDAIASMWQQDEEGNWYKIPLHEVPKCDQTIINNLLAIRQAEDVKLEALLEQEAALIKESRAAGCSVGGTLLLCDLAGAEYGATADRQLTPQQRKEGQEINKTLLALKECIRRRHSGASHVPYRNSRLTQILREYLEILREYLEDKDAQTVMVSNVSPSAEYLKKTVNTLQYASLVAEASAK
ncbi:kinesin-like protein [Kipferlia bialata]|uniref:Kinesin-like protein n=1 Tax=Kipferlia bialata TaxID=797122 RepID=A0A9K3CNX9_9EUKA|nr:kinesin-like protein [Kipferlia bialata]|eukprot:g1454.t1